jgi:hypothetical protein
MKTSSPIGECYMIQHRLLFPLFLGLIGAESSACSVYVDSDRVQCTTDSDCTARGTAFAGSVCTDSVCHTPTQVDPTWACLDETTTSESSSSTVHVNLTVVDLLSEKPLSGVTLTLCAKLDASCSFSSLPQYQSNDAGAIDVEMPAGFDGYLQAEGAGIYPTLIFPPSTTKQRAPTTLPIVPASFFGTMFQGLGVTVASDRSVILTTALDCLGRPAAGIALASPQADDSTVSYVLQAGLPSSIATTTDSAGIGGFVNIKTGGAVITSTIAANNRLAGTVGVQTRAGHLTMVLVMPTGG